MTGWESLTLSTPPPASSLKIYLFEVGGKWIMTPLTDEVWDWNTFYELPGTYTHCDGTSTQTFACAGGESGTYGIGCSPLAGDQLKAVGAQRGRQMRRRLGAGRARPTPRRCRVDVAEMSRRRRDGGPRRRGNVASTPRKCRVDAVTDVWGTSTSSAATRWPCGVTSRVGAV